MKPTSRVLSSEKAEDPVLSFAADLVLLFESLVELS